MAAIPIGLQLYSVREDCAADLPVTLAAASAMGYDGVEFAGYYGYPAAELRRILDDLGLKCCGTHTGLDTLLGDALARTVEFNRTLGNTFLIVPGLPEENRCSREAWLKTAGLFNELAEKAQPEGMQVGYHNHTIEFQPLDGELPWDTFFANTRADVIMQLDVGNAMQGGGDPLDALRRYPGRATTVHVKEFSATNDKAVAGEGDAPWEDIFAECEGAGGTQWYIVEQESYPCPPLECVDQCLRNLREMGK